MSLLINHYYQFGEFTLDTDQRVLVREGKPVALTPKVYDTLLILVENNGRIVEKEELMNRLWPDTFVEESNLTFNIKQLRKSLGDDARQPVYIETVARRGYRFIANVEELLTDDGVGQITRRFDTSESQAAVARKDLESEAAVGRSQPSIESADAHHQAVAVGNLEATATAVAASASAESMSAGMAASVEGSPTTRAGYSPRAATSGFAGARPTFTIEYLAGEIKKKKVMLFAGLLMFLGVVGTLFYGIRRSASTRVSNGHFQRVTFKGLTIVGSASAAAISPDGKFISYAVNENGKYSLWTKAIATGSAVQIVPPSELNITTTTFSTDGDYVYYVVRYKDFRTVLYRIPVLGGKPSQMQPDVGNDVSSFSPDGRQFAFVRASPDLTESQLYVAATEGDERRVIATRPLAGAFSNGPSWSPDGKIIAVGCSGTVLGVSIASGEVQPLTQEHWDRVGRVVWFRDGSGLAVAGRAKSEDRTQIWHVTYPSGETRRITNDLVSYDRFSLSVTSNDRSLVTVQEQNTSSIWVAPDADAGRARQLIARANSYDGVDGLAWASDGRIVFTSRVSGRLSLWVTDRDGSNPQQLTDSPASDSRPCVSPDGRYVVFISNRSGEGDLWRVDVDGRNEKQLTVGEKTSNPTFSPDGRWVIYARHQQGMRPELDLWRVPVDGGSPVRLTDTKSAGFPAVSPDGKLIAYYKFDVQDRKTKVVIIPFTGGAPLKTLVFTFDPTPWLRWSPDGRALIYNDTNQGASNLWRLPLDGGSPQQVTDFKSDQIWCFDFTRDGRQLAVARGNATTDVVLIGTSE